MSNTRLCQWCGSERPATPGNCPHCHRFPNTHMENNMKRSDAIPYVGYVVDDAGCGRKLGDDIHAIVREDGDTTLPSSERKGYMYASVLVGWQCGFEPMFVAVHSYLDVHLQKDDVVEMATDYLSEIGWFAGEPTEPDYIIR